MNKTVDELKKEIEDIKSQMSKRKLSPSQTQTMMDLITDKKREIERLSRTEKMITPIIGAPTIGEKSNEPDERITIENRFFV